MRLAPAARLAHLHISGCRAASSASARQSLPPVDSIVGGIDDIDIDDFRQRAFIPETPLLVKKKPAPRSTDNAKYTSSIPAAVKWFAREGLSAPGASSNRHHRIVPSQEYLYPFQDTILPYELTSDVVGASSQSHQQARAGRGQDVLTSLPENLPAGSFHRFNAPLELFLKVCSTNSPQLQRLYIAQAQIADLPKQLREDLPTPRLVKEAGKGDIYDANIWMGLPPTYTPLHRDPNPNLFVQLASSKRVRLYTPSIGAGIFRDVQLRIGQSSHSNLRGDEMMEGPERDALKEAIWGGSATTAGFEAVVTPGEALFIPKGWWHSIKSIGTDVTASVNWWFR
jgi:hypothetical protein